MGIKRTPEFGGEAVRIALSNGLKQQQIADALGIGLSTLAKWITSHKHAELMTGPYDDKDKELARLRKENQTLCEECDLLKKRRPSSRTRNSWFRFIDEKKAFYFHHLV